MKKTILTAVLIVSFSFCQAAPFAWAGGGEDTSETQILVDMLVDSGVLTGEQAKAFASKAKELAARKKAEASRRARARGPRSEGYGNLVETRWDNRLEFETRDGNFKGAIGGRVHADAVYVSAENDLENFLRPGGDFNRRNDRALIRRARIYIEGDVYRDFFYKLQYDFTDSLNNENEIDGLRGAYIGMQNIPYIGKFRVGQFKEPFSLEELTSSNYITFIERGLPNVFTPGYSWGAGINNSWLDNRVTFGLGAFRNSINSGTMSSSNEWGLTTRITGLPWYEDDDRLLHIGTSYSLRFPSEWRGGSNNNTIDLDTGPELRTRDDFVNTTNINVNMENLLGFEGALVYGPLSLQGEFIGGWMDDSYDGQVSSPETSFLYGAYGYVSYFLTGEHRKFDKSRGEFEEISPITNFSISDGTWGAWELAARYSHIDLNNKDVNINGGVLNDITVGVNWYLNPVMRIMFNYVHSHRNGIGYADGVQARFQVEF
ncbi:MAG: hypothetical protein GF408_04525 [Candidatus Omnitrophica bacterium]|nr:hypothetical protein [Candidatus Omnitrophota bacterium]